MEYNDIIKELEQIISELELGDCGLEKSAKLYERGVELASMLGKKLDETKEREQKERETKQKNRYNSKSSEFNQ